MALSKADIHTHTTCSDGLMTPEALVEYVATQTDIRVLAVTDHDTIEGGLIARAYRDAFADDFAHLDVIVGTEVLAKECEVIGLFVHEDIPPGLSAAETVERIHAQGGLALAPHPYAFWTRLVPGVGGMTGAAGLMRSLPFDAVETINSTPTEMFGNPLTAVMNRRWQQLPEFGGSDVHYLPTVGHAHTLFPGSTAEDLRNAIINGQIEAGGGVYSFGLIFPVIWGKLTGKFPVTELPPERAHRWTRDTSMPAGNRLTPA